MKINKSIQNPEKIPETYKIYLSIRIICVFEKRIINSDKSDTIQYTIVGIQISKGYNLYNL